MIEVGATPAALCAMKLQSAPRRPEARRYKTGSDYADLYRLLDSAADHDATVGALRTAPAGLGAWALDELHHRFDDEAERTVRAIRSATNLPLSEVRSRSCSSSCRCRAHRQLGTARPWFRPVNPKELEMIIRTNALDMLGVD